MKIYFNRKPTKGPWGGGSKILSAIVDECSIRGHEVFFNFDIKIVNNLDILFCMDPRPNEFVNFLDLIDYKQAFGTKIIQRVGDLGTHGKPDLLDLVKKASNYADVLIFPSEWAKNYSNISESKTYYVIQNAPLKKFIVKKRNKIFGENLRIISHHWSDSEYKGFEIYKQLDDYCYENNLKFTFVGRKPSNLSLKNCISPQDVDGLIDELPKHDLYITASKLEAGANHVLEAMALGLPVLYHKDGGSINEYCKNFGMQYDSFEELKHILENNRSELQKISEEMHYMRSSEDMAVEYVNLFEKLA